MPRLVIFVDEIDVTRSLPFSTDEFFAAIRQCYVGRATEEALKGVAFCLLGVATPSDLIQDTRMTPFNIGTRIDLTDFTASEAAPLAQWLASGTGTAGESQALLERVLYWTGGHPYLTQRLCRAVAEANASCALARAPASHPKSKIQNPRSIDSHCEALFLSASAREKDDNLIFVRERLLRSEADLTALLDLYSRVRSGKRVAVDDTNPLIDLLRLSGITRTSGARSQASGVSSDARGSLTRLASKAAALTDALRLTPDAWKSPDACLVVRNRIYARVFDRAWVRASMPDAELRRQRAAFRKGLLRSAGVACAVVGLVGALALSALRQRDHARRLLYVADMNLARQAVSQSNPERAAELLDEHHPRMLGEEDLRGFEWRHLWHLCQGGALHTFHPDAGLVYGVAYSPNGKTLAELNEDGSVRLRDVVTTRPVATFPSHLASGSALQGAYSVAFSPDGNMLAASSTNRSGTERVAALWDVARKRQLATFPACPPGRLVFSPDGKLLAAAAWEGPGINLDRNAVNRSVFKMWDVTAKQEVAALTWPEPLSSVAFSPDGKTIATAVGHGVVFWNVAAKRTVELLPTSEDWVQVVTFSPDGKTLATCDKDQTVRLWDAPSFGHLPAPNAPPVRSARRLVVTLKVSHSQKAPLPPTPCFAFSPDGKKLAVATDFANVVTLWDLGTRKEIASLLGHKGGVYSLAFSPDSETLATASVDGTVKLWSATPTGEGTALGTLPSELLSVAFSPDSQTLATGSADGTVTLWSAPAGPKLAAWQGHRGPVRSVALSRDGKLLASGGGDRTVKLWDVASRRPVATLMGHRDEVECLAFSPDGKSVASGSLDGTVKLWDPANRREITTLETGAGMVLSLSFSPDGRTLVLGTHENSVKLWDVRARREVASLPEHTSLVTATAFSPDGEILASGSEDHTIVLWNAATRRRLAPPLKGCTSRVNSLAFSHDGKTLASAGSDTGVKLWNVATGREVGTPGGPQSPVSCVAFAPDGNALAAVGKEGKGGVVRLWRARPFSETDARPVSVKPPPSPR